MVAKVIAQETTLEEMGGARMHCTTSGCGDILVATEPEAIAAARGYLSYLPSNCDDEPPVGAARAPLASCDDLEAQIPAQENKPFDMLRVIERIVDADSLFEIKALFAPEVVTSFARIDGRPVGIVANQPKKKGGVLFVDSADKAARFIWLCDAFGLPIVFLADVPGFMVGSAVERQGIIRHGAKMISAVSEATVPKLSVILRKAYGAGLYAMAGPAFDPDCCIALPGAQVAVMGPEAAINAVFFNQIQAIDDEEERAEFVARKRAEYAADIDILHLASELVVDAVVEPDDLRGELVTRLALARTRRREEFQRHHGVPPV